jgi:hypothetical protein
VTRPVDIGTVVSMLADRAEALARELLPLGHREASEWREARRQAGGLGDSLSVKLAGARAGVWQHGAAGQKGDALDLVAYLLFRGDKRQALAWSLRWLGLDTRSPDELRQHRRQAEERSQARARQAEEDLRRARGRALRLFLASDPAIGGTPVECYLLGRGIDLRTLGRAPGSLRYHGSLIYRDAATKAESRHPAMVASIVDHEGHTISVHRTYLQAHDDGRVTKAPLADAKKTYCDYSGGAVRLWHGQYVDAKTGEYKNAPGLGALALRKTPTPAGIDDANNSVVISEGIENGLTVAVACPERRVIAGVSLANMGNIVLPPAIRTVVLMADNDDGNRSAGAGLERAIAAHQARGLRVLLAKPPAGFKDINDLWTKGAA